ncbi:MAG: YggS family pyridoxal phosphate-dependent enzyme [Clostridia bacterium]|nr:YggS family pyridoxal phosphate-dependent enzyme [Clostridia bacterium]
MYRYIEKNLEEVRERIAAHSGGRDVKLVAVTKSGSDDELIALARLGALDIGENRPQELVRREALLREAGITARMHEIGSLQKNKVRHIAPIAAMIHSLDSYELALEIDKRASAIGRRIPVLIEINSGREAAKGGVLPEEAEALFQRVRDLPSIGVSGVMTMGPSEASGEELRALFRETRRIYENLGEKYGYFGEPTLSMGMSDSFEAAIDEGSTLVRVGRRLFTK